MASYPGSVLTEGGDSAPPTPSPGFAHDAFVYDDDQGFLAGIGEFVRSGLEAREAVVVVVPEDRSALLRDELGPDLSGRVEWAGVDGAGHNPGRLIPLWREQLGAHAGNGRRLRAVGELGPTRGPAEEEEAVLNEALTNMAFADATGLWLRCPYDERGTSPQVLEALGRTHPTLLDGTARNSSAFDPAGVATALFATALPSRPPGSPRWPVALTELRDLRTRVHAVAVRHGLDSEHAGDVVLATHEICKNSVRFAGGGTLSAWVEDDTLICEVSDHGRITEMLVGRSSPAPTDEGGRGLWLANQLCDLVQIRSSASGTVVRLHAVR
jgi:anti-sigma regulatory factor (Ser/Thr protein kinase)